MWFQQADLMLKNFSFRNITTIVLHNTNGRAQPVKTSVEKHSTKVKAAE